MKTLFFFLVFLFSVIAKGQNFFENSTFDAAIGKSKQTGKLIFLQLDSDKCIQCNEVADKAFSDKKLSELLQNSFVCIRLTNNNPDRDRIIEKYKLKNNFGTLFISSNENLIHNYPASTTVVKTYMDQIDKALFLAGEGVRISEFDKRYAAGNREIAFLEAYLLAKKTLNLNTDSLLDEYIGILPNDSLKSKPTLLFIAEMSPIINSKADSQLRKNYYQFIDAWNKLPNSAKISINNAIVYKSMQKAIREKNESYAYKVAEFRRKTYTNDPHSGQKAYDQQMVSYYQGINDTLNYLLRSLNFYDNYYMSISVDSIKRKDSLLYQSKLKKAKEANTDSLRNKSFTVVHKSIMQDYNRELITGASAVLEMTVEPLYLKKAISWALRANEFTEQYISLNVLAKIYYKNGEKSKAIETQKKAIEVKKRNGFKTDDLEKELAKMSM